MVMLSTSSAPKARRSAPIRSTASVVTPSGRPNGFPALWQASAASKKLSQVQASASLVGCSPAVYMAKMSMPAWLLRRSMRLFAVSSRVPRMPGTTNHVPRGSARYSTAGLTGPFRKHLGHNVLDRLQLARILARLPSREVHNVVAGPRQSLRGDRQIELVALGGEIVDREIDLLPLGPFLANLRHGRVGTGHPMVPVADAEATGRAGRAHEGCSQRCCRGGSRGRHQLAAREWLACHPLPSVPDFVAARCGHSAPDPLGSAQTAVTPEASACSHRWAERRAMHFAAISICQQSPCRLLPSAEALMRG